MSVSTSMPMAADRTDPGAMHGIGASLGRAWLAYLEWRDRQRGAAHLHALGDRELKDIGLSRSQIDPAVSGLYVPTPYDLRGRLF